MSNCQNGTHRLYIFVCGNSLVVVVVPQLGLVSQQ
jgi:hypothetical protein